jgi:uncharacterized protein YbjT (DUF2867 family)
MSQVLLTGATGLVGGHLLRLLQNEPRISTIAAPTRRPLAPAEGVFNPHDPQLTDALAVVDPVDIVFCCLGTTRREAGSKEAFVHADYTLVVDTALTGKRLGAQHMLVVSAMGANAHSPFFYNRVKGEMEAALIEQDWPRLTIARPSMLSGEREKKRANETFLAPLFRLLPGNWKSIAARDVAIALLAEALSPTTKGCEFCHHRNYGSAPRGRLNSGLQTQASGVVFTASIHIHISCWGMLWLVSLHLRRRHHFNGGNPRFSFSS